MYIWLGEASRYRVKSPRGGGGGGPPSEESGV